MKVKIIGWLVCLYMMLGGDTMAQSDLPKSWMSIGGGFGTNYGIIGSKTVVGQKNSGFLLGLGIIPGGGVGYAVGGQISANWFYANITYCTYGFEQLQGRALNTLTAGNLMLGGMINLNESKRTYIDLAIGHTFSTEESELNLNEGANNILNIGIGLMFRLGS